MSLIRWYTGYFWSASMQVTFDKYTPFLYRLLCLEQHWQWPYFCLLLPPLIIWSLSPEHHPRNKIVPRDRPFYFFMPNKFCNFILHMSVLSLVSISLLPYIGLGNEAPENNHMPQRFLCWSPSSTPWNPITFPWAHVGMDIFWNYTTLSDQD